MRWSGAGAHASRGFELWCAEAQRMRLAFRCRRVENAIDVFRPESSGLMRYLLWAPIWEEFVGFCRCLRPNGSVYATGIMC